MNKYTYDINNNIEVIHGIGEKRKLFFNQNNIFIIKDLLYYFPKKYEYRITFFSLKKLYLFENKGSIKCKIISITKDFFNKKLITKIIAYDNFNDFVNIICFYEKINVMFKIGQYYLFYGKILIYDNKYYLINPLIDNILNSNKILNIIPKYKFYSKYDISDKLFNNIVIDVLNNLNNLNEIIPEELIIKNKFPSILNTLNMIHNPKSKYEIYISKKKIIFEKLYVYCEKKFLQLNTEIKNNHKIIIKNYNINDFIGKLSFKLNYDQINTIKKLLYKIKSNELLYELIQGEVGCGKTIIALSLAYLFANNNYQVIILVPTEALAIQHYEIMKKQLESLKISLCVVYKTKKNIKDIIQKINNGNYKIIIGTHILLENYIKFNSLALIIIDEHHKFGVSQRKTIIDKAKKSNIHIIIMTATPIPRTIELLSYANFSLTKLLLKPFTTKVHTIFITEDKIEKLIHFFEKKIVFHNEQIYILCSSINSNFSNLISIDFLYKLLLSKLKSYIIIKKFHSKLATDEKLKIMNEFKNNKINILITTTVIEVGIDSSNATILLICNPERFGLAQLHQLRGRIGRNNKKNNFCFVMVQNKNDINNRLKIFQKINNCFNIAKYDMILRGSGNIFGSMQHGKIKNNLSKIIFKEIIIYFRKKMIIENNYYISKAQLNMLFLDN